MGSRIDTVQAEVTDPVTGTVANAAAITAVDAKVTTMDGKLTSEISRTDTLAAEVTDPVTGTVANAAAIQVVSRAQSNIKEGLDVMWGVKLQLNSRNEYVTAGIGLGISNDGGVAQSKFIVQSDQFIVQNGINGAGQAAFAVSDNKVVIRSALIGAATIEMAKIGGDLCSTDYVVRTSGWRLRQNGDFEINSTVDGQGRVEITNKGMRVYDSNDQLRVKIGDLS